MNRELYIHQARVNLAAHIERLDEVSQQPEAYIRSYFGSLRNEMDEKAERRLLASQADSEERTLINRTRQSIADRLDTFEKECLDALAAQQYQPERFSKYRLILDLVSEKYSNYSADNLEMQAIWEEYADVMMKIEDQKLRLCSNLLQQRECVFLEDKEEDESPNKKEESEFGHLLVITGTKFTDPEISWIKYFYGLKPTATAITTSKIVQKVNELEMSTHGIFFRYQLPRNLVVLEELIARGRDSFEAIDYESIRAQKSELTVENTFVSIVRNNYFSSLSHLESVTLRACHLERLYPDAFKGLNKLTSLSLHSNRLRRLEKDLFADLARLHTLDLGKNMLDSVEAASFVKCQHLSLIDLSHNHLERIDLASFSQLSELISLNLSHNLIGQITSDDVVSTNIDADSEAARLVVTSQTNSKLVVLLLNDNRLSRIDRGDFSCFQLLQTLDCSANQISKIDEQAFACLEELENLRLNDNLLEEVSENLLAKNCRIKSLRLEGNRLKKLRAARRISLDSLHLDKKVKVVNVEERDPNLKHCRPCVRCLRKYCWNHRCYQYSCLAIVFFFLALFAIFCVFLFGFFTLNYHKSVNQTVTTTAASS